MQSPPAASPTAARLATASAAASAMAFASDDDDAPAASDRPVIRAKKTLEI